MLFYLTVLFIKYSIGDHKSILSKTLKKILQTIFKATAGITKQREDNAD